MRSLLAAEISDNVFNCWCEILNKNESLRSPDSPYRLFLSTTSKENSLIKKMSTSFRWIKTLSTFKTNEFVPKISTCTIEDDFCILLMRTMEIYKGSNRIFTTGFKEKFGKPDLLAKRLRVKYCHAILTSDLNSMKEEVIKNATIFKETKTVIGRHISTVTDKELIDHVMAVDKDKQAVIIETEWMQVTRAGLQSLQPGTWISDMVIDLVGIYGTLQKPGLLYFPTIIKDLPLKKSLKNQYIKLHYFPKDLRRIQKVFFPILFHGHWFAMISDFHHKKNYILDSLLPRNPKNRINFTKKLMSAAIPVITEHTALKRFSEILHFDYETLNVPPQTNGYACGSYVLKWIDGISDSSSWTDEKNLEVAYLKSSLLGRLDSLTASQADSDAIMPSPRANASALIQLFARFKL
ncbi:hypothetical protein RND81_09G088600 [Saponaria officinalis]|uniref:Ubiquitin-like protease family profile domain-containing protein n=1 Tax=Saponaria officinalis TaxID=3572 RepID=A0AAW1IJE1_SAPOF